MSNGACSPGNSSGGKRDSPSYCMPPQGDALHPAEQSAADLLETASAVWRDMAGREHEEQLPWVVFVERLCTNPSHTMQTTRSAVKALQPLFCLGKSAVVKAETWLKFVCMFFVARPSSTLLMYNWTEADHLLDQPWFCGLLDKAGAQTALGRSGRTSSEFLVRYSGTLWRFGVFVLSKSYPGHSVVHTRIARHRPGEPWHLVLTRAGIAQFDELEAARFVYAATGAPARRPDLFYYAVPFADNPAPTRTVWPTLCSLVADITEQYRAQGHPFPLAPSKGISPYHE